MCTHKAQSTKHTKHTKHTHTKHTCIHTHSHTHTPTHARTHADPFGELPGCCITGNPLISVAAVRNDSNLWCALPCLGEKPPAPPPAPPGPAFDVKWSWAEDVIGGACASNPDSGTLRQRLRRGKTEVVRKAEVVRWRKESHTYTHKRKAQSTHKA